MTSVSPVSEQGKWSSSSGQKTNSNQPEQGRGFTRILTSWRAFRDSLAPMGYEDETGFHYGDRPEGSES